MFILSVRSKIGTDILGSFDALYSAEQFAKAAAKSFGAAEYCEPFRFNYDGFQVVAMKYETTDGDIIEYRVDEVPHNPEVIDKEEW